MSEHRQRTERHVQISPYERSWDTFYDMPTSSLFDQDFGSAPMSADFDLARQRFFRDPWTVRGRPITAGVPLVPRAPMVTRQLSGGMSQVTTDENKFKVTLDVKHFTPEEITVKTVDGSIEVHGKHHEKEDDHGVVSRDFTRKYTIPPNVDPLTVTSSLSPDGILTVEAPIRAIQAPTSLPVQHLEPEATK
uniref:SHSP domain-containing protein n=1 Tax=Ciona intestinalis TaxID=7719 RepID=F6RRK4_CIOIN|nr:heat shock protein HSP27-like protein [Ciona intestinalis]|eukprot:XP_002119131.1 alpha-crystallin A chain-like [Ciona intestinalis]